MIRALLPGTVVGVDLFGDAPEGVLLPAEEAVVAGVAAGRRREFATVRLCARRALRELGGGPGAAADADSGTGAPGGVALLHDADGVPVWPDGVVGSMTHTRGYRAAAVARAADVARLGIDAEPDRPLRDGVLATIATPAELAGGAGGAGAGDGVCRDRLLFCAKEAAYKAWFPHARVRLGFRDVEVSFDDRAASGGRFTARVRHGDGELPLGRRGRSAGRCGDGAGGRPPAGGTLTSAELAPGRAPAHGPEPAPGTPGGGGHSTGA
ncbi:4'-phosphopantetheinyl transferase [Streptomyces sp. NPDC059835]|uniref:4'-phosphopantetheinyl transferase family protein n=1 Tax=Streptomyces sp. NPDC059835 TaxID=3346967 RepID=UPI00365700C1